jgi:hypothetical protein
MTSKEYLLVLRATSRSKNVEIAPLLGDLLRQWNGRDRLSPLFEIYVKKARGAFKFERGAAFLLFVGPVNPAQADSLLPILRKKSDRAWLTFGLFNLVIYTTSRKESGELVAWTKRHPVPLRFELWNLDQSRIKGVRSSPTSDKRPDSLLRSLSELPAKVTLPELRDATNEYCALLAGAACRSMQTHPQIKDELELANSILTKAAFDDIPRSRTGDSLASIALLVDSNAALSRFSSQMFSGVPPIFESECHFWTHSLLGTGVANLALVRIRRFITQSLGEARIPDQVDLLRNVTRPELMEQVLNDGAIWDGPWLHRLPDVIGRNPLLAHIEPLAPLITYLSGRDGFHTTQMSLSAPLNILTSSSSLRWSLLTITHEMSHRVIDEVLSYILPKPSDKDELSRAVAILNEKQKPQNLLECLQFRILYGIAALNAAAPQIAPEETVTERHLVDLMGVRREEIEEIMVHVFDFIYFYGADPKRYVPAIWRSWDAIPSLHRRLPAYLLRTLCAVLAKTWASPTAAQEAADAVASGLEDILRTDKNTAFIQDAMDYLKRERKNLLGSLRRRRILVGVVRTFLQSPEIVQEVRGQSVKVDKQEELTFDATPIENPLRFIEAHTSSQASVEKSFWLLSRLAFDTANAEPLRLKGIHR